jgi:hypothetical protein
MKNIILIDKKIACSIDNILKESSEDIIFVCDMNIKGIEGNKDSCLMEYGYKFQGVVDGREVTIYNIDHHGNDETFFKPISSANLAGVFMSKYSSEVDEKDFEVIINHADCDSISSSYIISNQIKDEEILNKLGEAAICADHLGAENDICDLLQSLEDFRDYNLSIKSLENYLNGEEQSTAIKESVIKRKKDRETIKELSKNIKITHGGVAYIISKDPTDVGFLNCYAPDEALLVCYFQDFINKDGENILSAKVRLTKKGMNKGLNLKNIMLNVDERFGGRWNAGGNRRNNGCTCSMEEYLQKLDDSLIKAIR